MDIDRILKMKTTERDRLGMILSNRMDIMAMDKACISIDKWEDLASDLLKWHKSLVKSTLAPVSLDEQSEATVCVHTTGCALGYNCKRDKDGCDEFEPKQTEN